MPKVKRFPSKQSETDVEVCYQASEFDEINAEKHSLFEVLHDERLIELPFQERINIFNSWLRDNNRISMVFDRRIVENGCKTKALVNNSFLRKQQELLNLSTNDYLKLSQHPRVKGAAIKATQDFGIGAGSSSTATGITRLHRQLEDKIAQFKGCEDALVQSSGYATNVGVVSALLNEKDICIFDSYAHASLIDGMEMSKTNKVFFLHNDLHSLESMLKRTQNKYINRLVVVEGIYSMDGDIAPLNEIVKLTKKYGAWLLVDEAHSTGVLGKSGKGAIEYFGLEGQVELISGTFSKAIGGIGGFVAGNSDLINYIRFSSRSYIFATSAFVPAIAAALEAFCVIEDEPALRERLWENTNYVQSKLKEMGFNIGDTESCIIPVNIGNNTKVLELTQLLQNKGYLVNAVLYPAVPKDKSRIRFSVTSENTKVELESFLDCLRSSAKELGIM